RRAMPPMPLLLGFALVVILAVVPPLIGGYLVRGLTSYLIFGLLALAVGLITGYGLLFNLGVGANFGVSAYTVAILTHHGVQNPLVGNNFYWFVLGVVAALAALSWYVLASQTGKAIQAIGRNPGRAAAMGYSVPRYRIALTIYASLIASFGGWLYALQTNFVF